MMVLIKKDGINNLIFKELIRRGYTLEEGKKVWSVADTKLLYLTPEQSEDYLRFVYSSKDRNKINEVETELIIENASKMIWSVEGEELNVIDLGCSDGKKALRLLEEFKKTIKSKIRYCPIDISGYMVSKAGEEFYSKGFKEVIKFHYNISDFENLENITPLLRKDKKGHNILLMLGNTLVNFEPNELLFKIRESMIQGETFVTDISVDNERIRSYVENKDFKKWVGNVPTNLGLDLSKLKMGVKINGTRWEYYYEFLEDSSIIRDEKRIDFKIGDRVVVIVAYRHTKEQFEEYLKLYFDEVNLITSKDGLEILAICKK